MTHTGSKLINATDCSYILATKNFTEESEMVQWKHGGYYTLDAVFQKDGQNVTVAMTNPHGSQVEGLQLKLVSYVPSS